MGPSQFKKIFTIPPIDDLSPVYFVKLELRARNNNLISDNFYWLSAESPSDFTQLEELSPVELRVSSEIQEKDGENIVDLTIENPSRNLAFFVHPIITKGFEGEEVLPIFWEDNYFNLLPGEKKKVKASFSKKTLEGVTPVVKLTGWNISR